MPLAVKHLAWLRPEAMISNPKVLAKAAKVQARMRAKMVARRGNAGIDLRIMPLNLRYLIPLLMA